MAPGDYEVAGALARWYQEGVTGFDRFMDILEIEPDIQDASDAIALARARGEIEFRGVSFRYREGQDHILENLCLRVGAGEYVALIGPSGVGKTTLCSLIPRFYDVSSGEVLLDGVNVRDICLRSLRHNIGIVHQDVHLFAGTVAENIGCGKRDASRDEIIVAAKQANAHDLDNESERAVRDSLERLSEDRTTLVIAHRLSTVRNARRTIVLTEDGMAEQGSHHSS